MEKQILISNYRGLAKVTDLICYCQSVDCKLLILHLLSTHLYIITFMMFIYFLKTVQCFNSDIPEKSNRGEGAWDMDFPGGLKKQQVEFPGVSFKNVKFPGVIKKKSCGIPGLLVCGLKIYEGCNTILWSFQK